MGKASISGVFNAPIKTVYQVISDYSKYPEFLPEVKRVSVIDASNPEKKLIEMELQVIKSFRYQIWIMAKPPYELTWKFHTGEIFKDNAGSWNLKDMGDGKTHVDYEIEAKFGMLVPKMIEKTMIEVNLPSMLKAYQKRAEGLV